MDGSISQFEFNRELRNVEKTIDYGGVSLWIQYNNQKIQKA